MPPRIGRIGLFGQFARPSQARVAAVAKVILVESALQETKQNLINICINTNQMLPEPAASNASCLIPNSFLLNATAPMPRKDACISSAKEEPPEIAPIPRLTLRLIPKHAPQLRKEIDTHANNIEKALETQARKKGLPLQKITKSRCHQLAIKSPHRPASDVAYDETKKLSPLEDKENSPRPNFFH